MRPTRWTLIALWLTTACAPRPRNENQPAVLDRHPYELDHPIDQPVPFAAGQVTTVNGLAFTPDGGTLYTANWVADRDSTGRRRLRIFEWHDRDGRWHDRSRRASLADTPTTSR